MSEGIKIKCSIDDLTKTFESKCGIANVVIENAKDVDKLVTTLLAQMNAFATAVSGSKIEEKNVIIQLHYNSYIPTLTAINLRMNGIPEAQFPKYFIEQVRKLQELLSSKK